MYKFHYRKQWQFILNTNMYLRLSETATQFIGSRTPTPRRVTCTFNRWRSRYTLRCWPLTSRIPDYVVRAINMLKWFAWISQEKQDIQTHDLSLWLAYTSAEAPVRSQASNVGFVADMAPRRVSSYTSALPPQYESTSTPFAYFAHPPSLNTRFFGIRYC